MSKKVDSIRRSSGAATSHRDAQMHKLKERKVCIIMDFNNIIGSATVYWSVLLDNIINLFREADDIVFSVYSSFVGREFVDEYELLCVELKSRVDKSKNTDSLPKISFVCSSTIPRETSNGTHTYNLDGEIKYTINKAAKGKLPDYHGRIEDYTDIVLMSGDRDFLKGMRKIHRVGRSRAWVLGFRHSMASCYGFLQKRRIFIEEKYPSSVADLRIRESSPRRKNIEREQYFLRSVCTSRQSFYCARPPRRRRDSGH